jgi:hypothetical protein
MKKQLIIAIIATISFNLSAQNSKTQSSHSIKGPVFGLSYSYEHPIAKESTLNMELIFNGGFGSGVFYDSYWVVAPALRIEPRYYYNLTKRFDKGKKTINNSANYLAFAADYQPGISVGKNMEAIQYLQIVPKYGLKRTIGQHFIFEVAAGVGTYIAMKKNWEAVLAIDLKFGYAF